MINFTDHVQLLEESDVTVAFTIGKDQHVFWMDEPFLSEKKRVEVGPTAAPDQVLLIKRWTAGDFVLYAKSGNAYAVFVPLKPEERHEVPASFFNIKLTCFTDFLFLKQTGDVTFSVYDGNGTCFVNIHDLMTHDLFTRTYPADLGLTSTESRYISVGKAEYAPFTMFILYDLFKKELITRKILFSIGWLTNGISCRIEGPTELIVATASFSATADIRKLPKKGSRLFTKYQLEEYRQLHLLGELTVNGRKYYLHNKSNGVYLTRGNPMDVSGFKANLKACFIGKNLYLFGRCTHYAYQASGKYDYLYAEGAERPVAVFRRPFPFRLLRRYGFFKIPVAGLPRQETKLFLGSDFQILHALHMKHPFLKNSLLDFSIQGENVLVFGTGTDGIAAFKTVPVTADYSYWKRHTLWLRRLKTGRAAQKLIKSIFVMIGKLPKKKKLVMFESFHAKQYSDSPRAIYEYMKTHKAEYQLLWSIDRQAEALFKDLKVPYVRRFTLRWLLTFPRAKYWINNVRLPGWMPRPPGTVYVQTWHGTPLKRLGLDIEEVHMPGTKTESYHQNFVNESRKWSYLISPNPYSSEIFRRAFHFKGTLIESGYPRNDVLSTYTKEEIEELRRLIGIPAGKKVMLYAPTWRDNEFYQKGKYRFNFQFSLDKWTKEFGESYVLLTRMHYLVAEHFDFSSYEGVIYDVSSYPDIRDLYLVSDLLITDYSSVFFDYAVLGRPIVFFMYDLETYRDQLRGFYLDIEHQAPGPIVQTEQALFEAIRNTEGKDVRDSLAFQAFRDRFTVWEDGHAAERAVEVFLTAEKSE